MALILFMVSAGTGEIWTISGAFGSRLHTILCMLRCQWKEVVSVSTSSRKEVISFLTSYCKEVLAPCRIQEQANARSRKKLPACRGKKNFLYTHGTHASLMRMKNPAYHTNRYDNTPNRFEYRRKQSIHTSSALVSLKTRLERNKTHLTRRW